MLRGNEVTDLSFGAWRWFRKWSEITPTDTRPPKGRLNDLLRAVLPLKPPGA
jgi:hypothetical protein